MTTNPDRIEYPFQDDYERDTNGDIILPIHEAFAMCCENPWALERIAEQSKTYELCLLCAKTATIVAHHSINILQFVPKTFKTYELCMFAIKLNPLALESVPRNIINYIMALTAVSINGMALYAVPKALVKYELCKIAVENDGEAIFYVEEHMRSQELFDIATLQPKVKLLLEIIPIRKPFHH